MDKLCGKKVDRSCLFDNDGDGSDHDEQDFVAFERMMESRLKVEQPDQAPPPVESKTQDATSEDGKGDAKSSGGDIPMFRLFAGAGPVKVKSLSSEVEYIQPKRPEVAMEESDSEDHWSALAAAAIDAQTIRAVAQIPLPAMLYPKRVIHIPMDKKQSSGADQVPATRGRRRRRHHKLASGKLDSKAGSVRYVRVLSPYTGGTVKGKMLADVVREEEEAASAALRRANSTRGGRGGGRGGAGFSGRGRGRGRGRGGH
ncbi:hypothetical protein GGF42_008096 [Coemansia sp. RSA 2424]|nr:hypothetical protein GGF42_008096 [Coemansia sp. RSA 2424]